MIQNNEINDFFPKKVLILGKNSFIGKSIIRGLEKIKVNYLALGRSELDLSKNESINGLKKYLEKVDCMIFISAVAPVKDMEMFNSNLKIIKNVSETLINFKKIHVINISSDAVYSDSKKPLNENSLTYPESLHGLMHLNREILLRQVVDHKYFVTLRPTLIYGSEDPHNGYGPNSFVRLVKSNKNIKLFGEGEELRDHVYVEDVANACMKVILRKSYGILNIASGQLVSFKECAEKIISLFPQSQSKIETSERKFAMPHNGYRPIDNNETFRAFPSFKYLSFDEGVKLIKNIKILD